MMPFNELNRGEQQAYLMLPIIQELKNIGGEGSTKRIKKDIVNNDENLPETITPDLLSKCIELNQQYEAGYQESVEVKNKQDIQNLMAANENGELVYL